MVEYKASLKLKIPQCDNIMGLSWETYNVVNCNYEFRRGVNKEGEVSTSIKGGTISLEILDLPTDDLMGWVFDHTKKYNGEITIFDTDQETLEQIYFENARCVDFKMHYKIGRKPYILTNLMLVVGKMQIGDVHFENMGR